MCFNHMQWILCHHDFKQHTSYSRCSWRDHLTMPWIAMVSMYGLQSIIIIFNSKTHSHLQLLLTQHKCQNMEGVMVRCILELRHMWKEATSCLWFELQVFDFGTSNSRLLFKSSNGIVEFEGTLMGGIMLTMYKSTFEQPHKTSSRTWK